MLHDDAHYLARPGAECEANADFARTLRHQVGEHAIDSGERQDERQSGQKCRRPIGHAIRIPRQIENLLRGKNSVYRSGERTVYQRIQPRNGDASVAVDANQQLPAPGLKGGRKIDTGRIDSTGDSSVDGVARDADEMT